MNRRFSHWLLAAAYALSATGAMLALHRVASHSNARSGGAGVTRTCCHAAAVKEPRDEPAPAPSKDTNQKSCALCDALAATAKSVTAPAERGQIESQAQCGRVAHFDSRPIAFLPPASTQPRAPPAV